MNNNNEEVLEPVSALAQMVSLRLEDQGEDAPTLFRVVRRSFGLEYRSGTLTRNELIGHLNSQSEKANFNVSLWAIEGLTNAETNQWEHI